MNLYNKLAIPILCFFSFNFYAQVKSTIDLKKGEYKVINREVTLMNEEKRDYLHVSEGIGNGLVILKYVNFSEGSIEFDLRVKDSYERTAAGVMFHGVNDSTYDAIYFNPNNFNTDDTILHKQAVSYISMPQNSTKVLRSKSPGIYENAINPAPITNDWVHVRIEVKTKVVKVFVNNSAEPCLVVNQLNKINRGFTGIWTGSESNGDFSKFSYISK